MKQVKITLLGLAVTASLLAPVPEANAWVAAGGYHGAYHPVPVYHGGCYGCGAAAGVAVGVVAGAAIASASKPTTVVVQQPTTVVVQQPANVVQGNLPLGTQVAALPPGASSMTVNGSHYYQSGSTWYKPYFGSSGVYCEVVPVP